MLNDAFPATLRGARLGEEWAFACLYRDVQPALLRYLRAKSPAEAADVASDVWLEVASGLERFKGNEQGFRAWVFTIGRRRLVDRVRYEARRPTIPLDTVAGELPGVVADVADTFEDDEATRSAIAMIRELPPDQAEVVLLRVVGELSIAEIASMLGRTQGSIRVLSHRGLRRLATLLTAKKSGRAVTP